MPIFWLPIRISNVLHDREGVVGGVIVYLYGKLTILCGRLWKWYYFKEKIGSQGLNIRKNMISGRNRAFGSTNPPQYDNKVERSLLNMRESARPSRNNSPMSTVSYQSSLCDVPNRNSELRQQEIRNARSPKESRVANWVKQVSESRDPFATINEVNIIIFYLSYCRTNCIVKLRLIEIVPLIVFNV